MSQIRANLRFDAFYVLFKRLKEHRWSNALCYKCVNDLASFLLNNYLTSANGDESKNSNERQQYNDDESDSETVIDEASVLLDLVSTFTRAFVAHQQSKEQSQLQNTKALVTHIDPLLALKCLGKTIAKYHDKLRESDSDVLLRLFVFFEKSISNLKYLYLTK